MMKKATIIALVVVLVFAVTGCGTKLEPKDAIKSFFDGVITFDSAAVTKALAPAAADNLGSASDYLKATEDPMAKPFVDYLKENATKITYEVTGTKINGDAATVTVKCKYVDGTELFGKIIKELYAKAVASALSGKKLSDKELTQMGVDLFKSESGTVQQTFTEKTIDIPCVKVDGTWYVKEVNDQLVDVVSSNLFTAAKKLAVTFGK